MARAGGYPGTVTFGSKRVFHTSCPDFVEAKLNLSFTHETKQFWTHCPSPTSFYIESSETACILPLPLQEESYLPKLWLGFSAFASKCELLLGFQDGLKPSILFQSLLEEIAMYLRHYLAGYTSPEDIPAARTSLISPLSTCWFTPCLGNLSGMTPVVFSHVFTRLIQEPPRILPIDTCFTAFCAGPKRGSALTIGSFFRDGQTGLKVFLRVIGLSFYRTSGGWSGGLIPCPTDYLWLW